MKHKTLLALALSIFIIRVYSQGENISYPLQEYSELPNPVPTSSKWKENNQSVIGWGSTDIRYKKEEPAKGLKSIVKLIAWKGERVSAQAVFSNAEKDMDISIEISDLKSKRNRIDNQYIETSFVRYVMTDELNKDGSGTCGYRKASDFSSSLSADVLDHIAKKQMVPKQTSRGIWIKIQVPHNANKGIYKGIVSIKNGKKTLKKLPLEVEVLERTLPLPKDWKFHLDLWQNPYAVARYHQVEPWSEAHFEALKKEIKPYVQAGGKSITASIMYKPWGGQTYDYFDSMVAWTKKADNSWHFDFSIFDKWVEFMHQMGVTKQINCYSMVPWKLSFRYFDEKENQYKTLETQPGTKEYEDVWTAMLHSFAKHLKAKNWFDKTYISMDERPIEVMQETIKIIKKADSNFKISLAGALHTELEPFLEDYCVALRMKYSDEVKEKRKKQGKITTYYTSCEEPYPNTFTFSEPAESEWLAWYAAKENLDGYLRWAYHSWVEQPLLDSRFISWGAGDTSLVYPLGRSSIRFERLMEGIQFYEKIALLKSEFNAKNQKEKVKIINEVLKSFDEKTIKNHSVGQVIKQAREIINAL